MRIALAGNPNSGKTTMYNALTGSQEKVGNWAGVTVDKKERAIKGAFCPKGEKIVAVDLPGAYSMSPFTSEESVTSEYIKSESLDAIINIVDATNLSRSLFFTTQLLELGIPVVVALNKADINKKKQTEIDAQMLSDLLGCPVIDTTSTVGEGLKELILSAIGQVGKIHHAPFISERDISKKEEAIKADEERFSFVNEIVARVEKRRVFTKNKNFHDKIDALLTNRWLGLPIFALVMFLVFQISQAWVGEWLANGLDLENGFHVWGLVDFIGWFKGLVEVWMSDAHVLLKAIVLEGIIEGVSAVVGFLPLVMVMYFLIALLEDCGYMARATVVLDPIFKRVGLSGKSVIPFVVGTGCAVPGVMACRTIKDERERRATAMLAPFMPCGAKLPLIALFTGAFFPGHGWIGTLMYFAGIAIILVCALIINAITGNPAKKNYFIIELPEYKLPSIKRAAASMLDRGWSYIVKAGTVILVSNFIIYMMQNFSWSFKVVENPDDSILATIATPVAYVIAPVVGVVAWQLAAAAITGFVAKECVVGTLATLYAFEHLIGDELEIAGESTAIASSIGISAAAGLAFMIFNLFTPPCFAAIGAMNAELKSKKWFFAGISLQLAIGFCTGFLAYFFGTLISGEKFNAVWMPIVGWIVVALFAAVVIALAINNQRKIEKKIR